jgi:glutamate racemase
VSSHLPIGIFDSGVGGLSVLKAIRQSLPKEDLLYVADSANAPYGGKPPDTILERALAIGSFLEHEGCKAVVVACNTATAIAVDALREQLTVPVVAMEPALKPAAARTRSGVVGVLATSGTLASPRYATLRSRHGGGIRVVERICPRWVELVERGELDTPEVRAIVAADLAAVRSEGADVLVLGCTHFPFLVPLIETLLGPEASVLDPSPAVAAQLARQLEQRGLLAAHATGRLRLLSTAPSLVSPKAVARMLDTDAPWERLAL